MKKRKPLALVYSDLHLNIWPKFNENNRRLWNGIGVIDIISEKAQELKVPKLFLGDLFHKEDGISNELFQIIPNLKMYFTDFEEMTYAITGNHDQSSYNTKENPSSSYIKTLSDTFPSIHCVDFKSFDIGDYRFYGVPYLTNDTGLIEYISKIGKEKSKKKKVLLLHTTLPTARDTDMRTIHSNLEENDFLKATDGFSLVLSGHIHKPEEIIKDFMYSIGAPQQQRATDRNCDMGYWILYDDLHMEFIHLDNFPRFIYYMDESEIKDDGNFYLKNSKTSKRKKEISLDLKKELSSTNVNKVVKKYCKAKSVKDKRKISSLTKVLKEVL